MTIEVEKLLAPAVPPDHVMEKWERDYGNANPSIDDVQLALADASFAVFEANVRARPKYTAAFALAYAASLPKAPWDYELKRCAARRSFLENEWPHMWADAMRAFK